MSKSLPNTKNWKAWQNLQPPGPPRLTVTGEVETTNSNQTPHLSEASPQGINPEILLLDLSITTAGTGLTVIAWKQVTFAKEISKDQYSSVDIFSSGEPAGSAQVETVV
jgi:hypothetical protein